MAKQREALAAADGEEAFALLMEMGTGKSKIIVDEASQLYCSNDVQDVVIGCPNGLQRNWLDEFAKHCPVPFAPAFYEGRIRAADRRNCEQLLKLDDPRILRLLVVSYECLSGEDGFNLAWEFVNQKRKLYMALDEAQRIKSTKRRAVKRDSIFALGRFTDIRRLASGTITPNSPVDLYSPFKWLDPDIIGMSSVTAFRNQYCELEDPDHPRMQALAEKIFGNPARAKYMQVVKRDKDGRPMYKNLDQLSRKIGKYSFHALKTDCLDLPPKVYAPRVTFELTPRQRKIYNEVKKNIIAEFVHKGRLVTIDSEIQIVRLARLAAISGNHFPDGDANVRIEESKNNPRLKALRDWIDNGGGTSVSTLIWARHTPEIDELCEAFQGDCVRYDGTIKDSRRLEYNRKAFLNQDKGARVMIGQTSMGIGFDAYSASLVAFYTNSFNLEHRLQAEDRAHRKGLKHTVTYGDFEALDTGDLKIIGCLRAKREVSEMIHGDPITNWI